MAKHLRQLNPEISVSSENLRTDSRSYLRSNLSTDLKTDLHLGRRALDTVSLLIELVQDWLESIKFAFLVFQLT